MCYNERGSRTNYVRSSVPHCTYLWWIPHLSITVENYTKNYTIWMHRGQTSKHLCKHISSKKNAINPSAPELNAWWEVPKHRNFNSKHKWASD